MTVLKARRHKGQSQQVPLRQLVIYKVCSKPEGIRGSLSTGFALYRGSNLTCSKPEGIRGSLSLGPHDDHRGQRVLKARRHKGQSQKGAEEDVDRAALLCSKPEGIRGSLRTRLARCVAYYDGAQSPKA